MTQFLHQGHTYKAISPSSTTPYVANVKTYTSSWAIQTTTKDLVIKMAHLTLSILQFLVFFPLTMLLTMMVAD